MKFIGSKVYLKIPGGEVQVGRRYGSLTLWFRGKVYRLRRPKI